MNRVPTENPMPMTLKTTNKVTLRAMSSASWPRQVQ